VPIPISISIGATPFVGISVTFTVRTEVAEGHPEVPEVGEVVSEGLLKSPA
jgi:hypothetical protein